MPGLVGNEGEDVGVAIPASQRWETPVKLYSRDNAVVVVEGVVCRVFVTRNSSTKKYSLWKNSVYNHSIRELSSTKSK